MASRHLSIRIEEDAFERLDAESRRTGRTRSEVAKTLLEEGLRQRLHPGIVFRTGPTGRRPGLVGGPDVWEVARVLRSVKGSGDAAVRQTARRAGLSLEQVRTALRYYAEHRGEIDAWIARVDEEAARDEAAARRERAILGA